MTSAGDRDRPLVIVADDDPDILALVSYRLGRAGYDVVPAEDGEEALRLARELAPDLVLLDVRMPKLDGYGVARGIRDDPAISGTPVILLTASVRDEDFQRGLDAGADDQVKKPFSPQELTSRVETALERR